MPKYSIILGQVTNDTSKNPLTQVYSYIDL